MVCEGLVVHILENQLGSDVLMNVSFSAVRHDGLTLLSVAGGSVSLGSVSGLNLHFSLE